MSLVHRRIPLLAALSVLLLLVAYLAVTPGRAGAAGPCCRRARRPRRPRPRTGLPGRGRGRRQHRHPLGQRVHRPAVVAGRPGRDRHDRPGHAGLGGGVRRSFQIQVAATATGRSPRLLHHDRRRRGADAGGLRVRPVRADERDGPGDRVGYSLWEFQVFGTLAPARLRHGQRGARAGRPPRPRSRTRAPRRPPPSTATGTRWSSAFADPQWLQVDLGATARSAG